MTRRSFVQLALAALAGLFLRGEPDDETALRVALAELRRELGKVREWAHSETK